MYLTKLPDPGGDDYSVHQHLAGMFDRQKILFQRKGFEIDVLSPRAVSGSRNVSAVIEGARQDEVMLFTVRMNPVVTRFIEGRNRRVALGPDRIRAWVVDMFDKHGFAGELGIRNEGVRCSRCGDRTVTLASILVTGVLTVADPDRFRRAVCQGIGHGKGFGFGLLNIFNFR